MPSTCSFHRCALAAILLVGAGASRLQAAEASLVSGLYKSEQDQIADVDYGKKQTIDVGARFSDALSQRTYWFVTGLIQLKSYSNGALPSSPSDTTGLSVAGGLRYYFTKLGENLTPYAEGQGALRDEKDATHVAGGWDATERNGLYYGGSFGIRLNLAREFFVDVQTALFDSALFATEKTDHVRYAGTTQGAQTTTTDQTKRTELYASSANYNSFGRVLVSMGMRF